MRLRAGSIAADLELAIEVSRRFRGECYRNTHTFTWRYGEGRRTRNVIVTSRCDASDMQRPGADVRHEHAADTRHSDESPAELERHRVDPDYGPPRHDQLGRHLAMRRNRVIAGDIDVRLIYACRDVRVQCHLNRNAAPGRHRPLRRINTHPDGRIANADGEAIVQVARIKRDGLPVVSGRILEAHGIRARRRSEGGVLIDDLAVRIQNDFECIGAATG